MTFQLFSPDKIDLMFNIPNISKIYLGFVNTIKGDIFSIIVKGRFYVCPTSNFFISKVELSKNFTQENSNGKNNLSHVFHEYSLVKRKGLIH